MADDALESWLRDHRAAHPRLDAAWVFLRRAPRRDALGAFEALKQEWLDAVYAIHAPSVAATKLQWWIEECGLARDGRARHPLTQAVFADAVARAIPPSSWNAMFHAAGLQLEAAPAADLSAQVAQTGALHGALARIETALWFGTGAGAERACGVAAVQGAIAALRNLPMEIEHGRTPLPMALLARHGLSQGALLEDTASRRAALHGQIGDLLHVLDEADTLSGPLGLFRGLQARLDRRALRHAARAEEPLGAMQRPAGGLPATLDAWRAARAWHAAAQP
ncbi:MAG: squalene/phytoene synthase family protein [Proteobacteria bacterium]|nr:squalene/phytoene synthase family protein [Pseudomonadota bacterium]